MHRQAEVGFGRASAAYERGRPDYPLAAVEHACARVGLEATGTALDLGAGTGKLTRLLEGRAARVIAVEPVDAMRAELAARAPFAEVLAGTAERVPLSDGAVDAVLCAQAFHWFDGPRALAEIARVLRPRGGLALIWNRRDEATPWVAELTGILDQHERDVPRHRSDAWRAAFAAENGFAPLETAVFGHQQPLPSLDALVDRVASVSFVAALDDAPRRALLEQVRELGARQQVKSFPYRTEVHTCRRLG